MLLDVPLDDLAANFREVILVDLVHPLRARWHRRKYANVTPLVADVTGTVALVYRVAYKPGAELPRSRPEAFLDDDEVDLVASVNLISQLPYLPVVYLERAGVHGEEAIAAYARQVVEAHIEYLSELPGVVALIGDLDRRTVDREGRLVECLTALRGARLPWKGEEWIWNLAPRPEAHREYSYQRRVVGIANLKTAAAADHPATPA